MALMERVATLLRANVNDLIDRAEDPEKMLKQLLLDMENQLLQVKTQVAIALADQHLLEKKAREQEEGAATWHRKAELAVTRADDALARAALERAFSHETLLTAFKAQVADQSAESESLRSTYLKLQSKLIETKGHCELLIAQHRRARMVNKAAEARGLAENGQPGALRAEAMGRVQSRIAGTEAKNFATKTLMATESLDDRFANMERDERVEKMLSDLKNKQTRMLAAG